MLGTETALHGALDTQPGVSRSKNTKHFNFMLPKKIEWLLKFLFDSVCGLQMRNCFGSWQKVAAPSVWAETLRRGCV